MSIPSAEAQTNSGDGMCLSYPHDGSGFNLDMDPTKGAEKLFWTHHCQFVRRLLNLESNVSSVA